MKIVLAGGGTGGHFYPLIAVAEEIYRRAAEKRMVSPKIYYIANKKYDEAVLYDLSIEYIYCPAGKIRISRSNVLSFVLNFFDLFRSLLGIVSATLILYKIYPDVIFSKGGHVAFPVCIAAKILKIPIVIHESDAIPGRVTLVTSRFASHIALSYAESEKFFSSKELERAALTGIPIRSELIRSNKGDTDSSVEFFNLDPNLPVILVLGGSSGAKYINDNILDSLNHLLKDVQIIHQTGEEKIDEVKKEVNVFVQDESLKARYHPVAFLDVFALRKAYSIADLVISRSGSTTLSEVSYWGIPSILIPIPEDISRDQKANAYAYARAAGGIVIEQRNLSPNLLTSQVNLLLNDKELHSRKKEEARGFSRPDAAFLIAGILIDILIEHES